MSDIDCNGAGMTNRSDEVFSQDLHRHSTCMCSGTSQAASGRHDIAPVQIEPGQLLGACFGRLFLELIQRRKTDPEGRAIIPVDHPESNGPMLGLEFWPGFLVKSECHGHFPDAPARPDDRPHPEWPQDDGQEINGLCDALANRHVCEKA